MNEALQKNKILTHQQIQRKIIRIAFEIYENNFGASEIILAGIYDKGYVLARQISDALTNVSPLKIILYRILDVSPFQTQLFRLNIDKQQVVDSPVELNCPIESLAGKRVVLVDDVLSTGATLAYALKPFLIAGVDKLEIAVLVNRNLLKFPIHATYTGFELSTTLTEHIDVCFEGDAIEAFLY